MPKPTTPSTKSDSPAKLIEQLRVLVTKQAADATAPDDITRLERLSKELDRDRKNVTAILLAVLGNQAMPVKFYQPWASYAKINQAEVAGTLATIERRNGKVLITPANFFAWFNSLPADKRRGKPMNRQQ